MPQGDLLTGTVESVLHDLAEKSATGCLIVRDQEGDEAEVYLRDGQVYSVFVPGRRTMLGVRLMSSGALTPEALAEALEIQRTELQGWRLGELLVHLGYVDLAVVEQFVVEHLKDALADLMGWPVAAWKFRKGKKTRQDIAPPTPVDSLLDDLRDRGTTWESIVTIIGGTTAVPVLSSGEAPPEAVELGPNEWALLCKVDGERSVAELAADCGFTLFEAGQVVSRLIEAQLLGVEHPAELVLPVVTIEQADRDEAERIVEAERHAAEQAAAEQAEAERHAAEQAAAEQAEAERHAAEEAERRRQAIEDERLREADLLNRELEAMAAKEAAARQARQAARDAERTETEATQVRAQEQAARAGSEEVARAENEQRRAADEQARAAAEQDAAERAVQDEAERIAADETQRQVAQVERLAEEAAELAAREETNRLEQQQRTMEAADVTRRDEAMRAAEAGNILNELNREMSPAPEPESVPVRVVEEVVLEEVATGPEPMVARDHADTAMLLRELSSLGLSDDDRPSSTPPRPPRSTPPSMPSSKDKKRKGLFGRG
ncbi:MAG: DUF4388 domain-containing protein [Sporichthyaceae bacterium]